MLSFGTRDFEELQVMNIDVLEEFMGRNVNDSMGRRELWPRQEGGIICI